MLVATQNKPRSPGNFHDIDANEAATRIQALYRGRVERRKYRTVLKEQAEKLKQSPAAHIAKDADDEYAPAPTPFGKPATKDTMSSLGFGTATVDYARMRRRLLDVARCSQWPPAWAEARVSTYMLFEEPRSSPKAQILSVGILVCTLISILAFILETVPELKTVSPTAWLILEVVCTVTFSIEYLCRLCVCDVNGGTATQFILNPMNVTDLLAILPVYLWLSMRSLKWAKALGILRTVRLVRLFRIFKLGRYSTGLQLMIVALRSSQQALWVLGFFLSIGIVLFSSAIYYVERLGCPHYDTLVSTQIADGRNEWDEYQEECRANPYTRVSPKFGLCCDEHGSALDFPSIVAAFWWAVVTMTTVGFGEVHPRTDLGRLVGTVTMLSGILLIALPIAIIGQKFQEAYEDFAERHPSKEGAALARPIGPAAASKKSSAIPSAASKANASADSTPSLSDVSRRLRLMNLPSASLSALAVDLAEDVDVAIDLQREILSMQNFEDLKRAEVADRFERVLDYLCSKCDPDGEPRRPSSKQSKRSSSSKGKAGKLQKSSMEAEQVLPQRAPEAVNVPGGLEAAASSESAALDAGQARPGG